jgi:hypothetical protein
MFPWHLSICPLLNWCYFYSLFSVFTKCHGKIVGFLHLKGIKERRAIVFFAGWGCWPGRITCQSTLITKIDRVFVYIYLQSTRPWGRYGMGKEAMAMGDEWSFILFCSLVCWEEENGQMGTCPNGQIEIVTCPKSAKSTKWNYQNIEFAGDAIGA